MHQAVKDSEQIACDPGVRSQADLLVLSYLHLSFILLISLCHFLCIALSVCLSLSLMMLLLHHQISRCFNLDLCDKLGRTPGLCHPLKSSSVLPLSCAPFTFSAQPFIKQWLPYLICILLISCSQLVLMIPFHFIPSLFPPFTSSLMYLSHQLIILPVWIFSPPDQILPHG